MLQPITRNGNQINIDDRTLQAFGDQLVGSLLYSDHEEYDKARAVWNGMIDKHPALIVRCESIGDVQQAVNFAREHDLLLAVRGGGHSVAGTAVCDDGLVIDLSLMRDIQIDPDARTARVQGGATWADLDKAAQAHGLATPGGVVSKTGVAGLTLGGGFGWLRNKFGLSCDNLIGAEVVTADGKVINVSKTENSELLWGLRGGGGNFGIVTTFEFRLHPVGPEVMLAFVLHDGRGNKMKPALQFYRDFMANAPDEVSSLGSCGIVPPDEMFPQDIHGKHFVLFAAMYAGDVEEGRRVLQPLLDYDEPLIDFSDVMPYIEVQQMFDADYPDGMRYYWKSINLMTLDDQVIDRIVKHAPHQPSVLTTTDLWHIGGAVKRVDADESAFFGRDAAFLLNPEANWEDDAKDDANIRWVREFIADMQEFSDGSRYLNFAGFQEEGDAMMETSFGKHYQRLVQLKNKYDPHNLFSLNQNINPRRS